MLHAKKAFKSGDEKIKKLCGNAGSTLKNCSTKIWQMTKQVQVPVDKDQDIVLLNHYTTRLSSSEIEEAAKPSFETMPSDVTQLIVSFTLPNHYMELQAKHDKMFASIFRDNCFYDTETRQVDKKPLQLIGYREKDRFFLRSNLPLMRSRPTFKEEEGLWDKHGSCVLFFCEGRQLLAKVVMMDMIICIGTCCRPGESVRPAIARTSRAFKLCVEDCWAVLNLSSLEGAWLRCLDTDPRLQPQQLRAVYRAPAVTQPAPKKSRLQWPAKVCAMLRAPFARRARCRPTPSTG